MKRITSSLKFGFIRKHLCCCRIQYLGLRNHIEKIRDRAAKMKIHISARQGTNQHNQSVANHLFQRFHLLVQVFHLHEFRCAKQKSYHDS